MSISITKRPFERVFSGNPVHYELYSDLAASDPTISFEVNVRFKKVNGTYADVVKLPYSPVEGIATVDLKDILDSVLEFDLPKFNTDETLPTMTNKQTGFFYLQYREITTINPDPSWDDSEIDWERFVIKGGLNDFKYQGNNFFLNYFDVNLPFLTWQLNGRMAARDERMYLAWLSNSSSGGLKLVATVYWRDGSTSTKNVTIVATVNQLFYLPVGCTQLDLQSLDPTGDIWYWCVQVMDGTTPKSELFKYELDNKNDYIGITLNYRNSLGGLDSVRVRGAVQKKLDYTFLELQRTIQPDYFDGNYFTPQKIVSGNLEQLMYSGNIGFVKKEEQDRLRDAQLIRETWTEKGKKWVPVNILTKSFTLAKNDDMLWSMPIEFTLGYNGSEYYTPETVDIGGGSFTANVCTAYPFPVSSGRNEDGSPSGTWTLTTAENDPGNVSSQFRFRVVKNSDGSVARDWETIDWGNLAFYFLTDNTGTYSIEVQAICPNNVYGKKSTIIIDTTLGAPAGGGAGGTGGGTGGVTSNSYFDNQTAFHGFWNLDVDSGAHTDNGNIGAYTTQPTTTISPVSDVVVVVTISFSPSVMTVESNGVNYSPVSVIGGDWTFTHVDIIDGLRIIIQ